jgi:hypothetical protein
MGGAFVVIWGVALLAVVALGAILMLTLRQGAPAEPPDAAGLAVSGPLSDTLLFYYEEESVGRTSQGGMIVHIPGTAWDQEWRDDLLRLEVSTEEPAAVAVPAEWGEVRVLAAYSVRAYRMTEIGTDVAVERFAAPVDVFLTAEDRAGELRFGVNNEGIWTLAPSAALAPEMFEGVDIPAGRGWVAASVTRLREICLVSFPADALSAGREPIGMEPTGREMDGV